MMNRDFERGRGGQSDWSEQGNGYRGSSGRQGEFAGRGEYGDWRGREGQGEYGGPGYASPGQFRGQFAGPYEPGYDEGYSGNPEGGWRPGRYAGPRQFSGQGYGDEGQYGGWRGGRSADFGRGGFGGEGGWQPGYAPGRGFSGEYQGSQWDQEPGRGGWGQGFGRQRPWQGGQGFDTQSTPRGWFYEEVWLIPGPFTGRGPRGYQRSDQRIEEDICERLTQHGQLDADNIQIKVDNGEVTLTGTVENRQAKRMAEDAVDSISGVKDVHNQLRVQQGQGQMGQGESKTTRAQARGQSQSPNQTQRNEPVKAGSSSA